MAMDTAGGLGGVLASVSLGHREPPRHRLVALWIGWGLSGVGVLGLGLVPNLWLVLQQQSVILLGVAS
jgi:hypothetical protein